MTKHRVQHTSSIDRFQVLLQSRSIIAYKCISKLAQSRPPSASLSSRSRPQSASPNSLDYGLQVRTITASNCISKLARSPPQSASPNSLDHALQVHLSTRSITASKYIVNERRRVYKDTGVTEVDWATGSTYSGDPGVDRHHLIFISFSSHLGPCNCVDSHGRVVSYLLTFFLGSSS